MLTYKIPYKNDNIYRYIYFPFGKDYKIKGGEIDINIKNKDFNIISIAELDEENFLTDNEIVTILIHLNSEREKVGVEKLSLEKFKQKLINYKFAEKLIYSVFEQIDNDNIQDKGILF
ncbi:hypothetical protein [Helcococcus bovis]|uniref:hypothetical protein n=1 Tax=Helcococcus bovis TaxID=3153252 RepID=UPI0038B75027